MFQVVVVSLATYVEFFLLRRWVLAEFNAQRPLVMLEKSPFEFLSGELQSLLLAAIVAGSSILIARHILGRQTSGGERQRKMLVPILSLIMSLSSTYFIALGIKEVMLGT